MQGAPPQFQDTALEAANQAFVTAFNEILLIAAAITIAGGILGFVLVRRRDFVTEPGTQPEPAAA